MAQQLCSSRTRHVQKSRGGFFVSYLHHNFSSHSHTLRFVDSDCISYTDRKLLSISPFEPIDELLLRHQWNPLFSSFFREIWMSCVTFELYYDGSRHPQARGIICIIVYYVLHESHGSIDQPFVSGQISAQHDFTSNRDTQGLCQVSTNF